MPTRTTCTNLGHPRSESFRVHHETAKATYLTRVCQVCGLSQGITRKLNPAT